MSSQKLWNVDTAILEIQQTLRIASRPTVKKATPVFNKAGFVKNGVLFIKK